MYLKINYKQYFFLNVFYGEMRPAPKWSFRLFFLIKSFFYYTFALILQGISNFSPISTSKNINIELKYLLEKVSLMGNLSICYNSAAVSCQTLFCKMNERKIFFNIIVSYFYELVVCKVADLIYNYFAHHTCWVWRWS